jgi:hypothetical protein
MTTDVNITMSKDLLPTKVVGTPICHEKFNYFANETEVVYFLQKIKGENTT